MDRQGGGLVEAFHCKTLCTSRGQFVDAERARRGCSRPDLPPVRWKLDAMAIHRGGPMGRHPVEVELPPTAHCPGGRAMQAGIMIAADRPTEDPADGCPASWYWSEFIASIVPYLRRRDAQGNRVANLLLERNGDDLLFELVGYLENEQERFEAYKLGVMFPD